MVPPENNFVEIKVADSRWGILREDISRIFDSYFTRRENGAGLGLASVHRIIEEHIGYIDVESELKEGTSLKMRLPAPHKK